MLAEVADRHQAEKTEERDNNRSLAEEQRRRRWWLQIADPEPPGREAAEVADLDTGEKAGCNSRGADVLLAAVAAGRTSRHGSGPIGTLTTVDVDRTAED